MTRAGWVEPPAPSNGRLSPTCLTLGDSASLGQWSGQDRLPWASAAPLGLRLGRCDANSPAVSALEAFRTPASVHARAPMTGRRPKPLTIAVIPWCAEQSMKSPPCAAPGEAHSRPRYSGWARTSKKWLASRQVVTLLCIQVDGSILFSPFVHHQQANSPVVLLWKGLEILHDRLPFLDLHRGIGSSTTHRLILLHGSFRGEQIRPALWPFG
jgi:hypothetical protein